MKITEIFEKRGELLLNSRVALEKAAEHAQGGRIDDAHTALRTARSNVEGMSRGELSRKIDNKLAEDKDRFFGHVKEALAGTGPGVAASIAEALHYLQMMQQIEREESAADIARTKEDEKANAGCLVWGVLGIIGIIILLSSLSAEEQNLIVGALNALTADRVIVLN